MTRSLDETDIVLIQMLLEDSRRPERQVAEFLELTTEEVRQRISSLHKDGLIKTFIARLTPSYLRSVNVFIVGRCDITSLEEARTKLGKNDVSSWTGIGGGSRIYVAASLRRLMHLDHYLMFLREEVGMEDLTFGIRSGKPDVLTEKRELDATDFRILASLRRDARKSHFEVAEDIGVAREDVELRVQRMLADGSVEFSVELNPEATRDILCLFQLYRRGRGDLRKFMRDMLNLHSPHILFFNQYRNLPDLTMAMCWVRDMGAVREIKRSFERHGDFHHVEANPLLTTGMIENWADRLIVDKARSPDGK